MLLLGTVLDTQRYRGCKITFIYTYTTKLLHKKLQKCRFYDFFTTTVNLHHPQNP